MNLWMSGGARLLYIVRRAHVIHNDEAKLDEARQIAARLIGAGCEPKLGSAFIANAVRSSACPQRSEDSRLGAPLVALSAINFGGYGRSHSTCAPLVITGTTFTGQSA